MSNLLKIAEDLEKTADRLEEEASQKFAAERSARKASLNVLADKYASITGESLSEAEVEKLAASDVDVVRLLSGVLEKQAGAVESMGAPSERTAQREPMTIKEAVAQAEERFAAWAIS